MKSPIRKSLVALIAATFVITASVNSLSAQEEKESAGLVAVLDVAKVFDSHAGFKNRMAQIKSEADSVKANITAQQNAIRDKAQGLANFEVGSEQRNQMEATLEQEQAALRTKARQAETDLLNREAGIYYETYKDMQQTVKGLASQYGISLVLRFDSTEIDKTSRPDVIKGVNRAVVYHHKLDLTNMVIKQMNPASAQANTGTQNK